MKLWLVFSLMTAILWGLWGLFSKLATRSLNAPEYLLATAIGQLLLMVIYLTPQLKELHLRWMGIDLYFAILSGFVMMAGILLFYRALSIGEVAPIVVITACYPLVTLLLAYLLLKEPISLQKIVGACLTIAGICIISI